MATVQCWPCWECGPSLEGKIQNTAKIPTCSLFILTETYAAHQSVCLLRLDWGWNTQVWLSERWSIYWSDSSAHPHHSETQPQIVEQNHS